MRYDVAVCGLGAMGSAALAHSARRGMRAIGFDRYARGHSLGASTGRTRIIRKAYFEDAAYVPMLLRAYELWRELERETGQELLRFTGLLMVGAQESAVISGSRAAAERYSLPVDVLTQSEIERRFPPVCVRRSEVGVYERDGGIVFPERAVEAQLMVAERNGAQMRFSNGMREWEARSDAVRVTLDDGSIVEAERLIVATGPWIAPLFATLGIPIHVQRNVQVWFEPSTSCYDANAFPTFLVDRADQPAPLYGFPDLGDGVKAAFHGFGVTTSADTLARGIDEAVDVKPLASALERWMPGASNRYRDAKACMYSLTPDGNFVIDTHPEYSNVVICGGFSGHGFKFAPVVGEIATQLALGEAPPYDLRFLSATRFSQ